MTTLTDIPSDIIQFLQTYLSNDDYHYFMNTSKQHFQQIKKQTIIFMLTIQKSVDYIHNIHNFQNLLLEKVENGWKQISIQLSNNTSSLFSEIPNNLPIKRIIKKDNNMRKPFKLSTFSHIESIQGLNTTEQSIPYLPKTKDLSIIATEHLIDIRNLSHLTRCEIFYATELWDVTSLQNIPHVSLIGCDNIEDYSIFNGYKQESLQLVFCPNLMNVTSMKGIKKLVLKKCDNLVNISSLHGIDDLTISHCNNIRDISKLGNHQRFALHFPNPELIGYDDCLVNIPHVVLEKCNLTNATVLQYAKSVELIECNQITDTTPLKQVKCLIIQKTNLILGIEEKITSKAVQQKLSERLTLNFLPDKSYVRESGEIEELIISHTYINKNNTLSDLKQHLLTFQSLYSLTLRDSMTLVNVYGLGDIPILRLIQCYVLNDITGLGRNRSVEIDYCPELQDARSLITVPLVTIKRCAKLNDISYLSVVHRLKVIQ